MPVFAACLQLEFFGTNVQYGLTIYLILQKLFLKLYITDRSLRGTTTAQLYNIHSLAIMFMW